MKGPGFVLFLLILIFAIACGITLIFFPGYAYVVFHQIVNHSALTTSLALNFGAFGGWLWFKRTKLAYFCGLCGWLAAFQHDLSRAVSDGLHVLNFWLEALKASLF